MIDSYQVPRAAEAWPNALNAHSSLIVKWGFISEGVYFRGFFFLSKMKWGVFAATGFNHCATCDRVFGFSLVINVVITASLI